MSIWRGVTLSAFICLCSLAAPASAGQGAAAPAGVIGQVTDGTGAVLPGVTVTATSPALQVPSVVTVTDSQGEYRLSPLPIGTYTVTYELPGFQNVRREGVRLTVGFVAKLDQVLNVGALAETVTVSGASPVVDVTNTATGAELMQEALEALPTTRDGIKAIIAQVPGVRTNLEVGTSGLTDGPDFRIYGQTGQQWTMLEGVVDIRGENMDFGSVEETRVQAVGSNAEMPRRGLLIDAVVKSGGNDFHGDVMAYGSSGRLEGSNIDDALRAQGVTGKAKLHTLRDISGNLGGRIVRDKLWFFGAARYVGYDREVLDAFHADGTPVLLPSNMDFDTEKLSYQMTSGNRLIAFHHRIKEFQLIGATRFVPPESRVNAPLTARVAKGEWQSVRGNSLVTSLQYGMFDHDEGRIGLDGGGQVATRDISTLRVTGDNMDIGNNPYAIRRHFKGVVGWYRPNLLLGSHEFKAGFDHVDTSDYQDREARVSGNYQLLYNNGAPFQINTLNFPVRPEMKANYIGVYGQDTWTLARRLTLNLGLRFAHDNAYAPAQCRVAGDFAAAECWDKLQTNIWNSFAPRLHAAFDLFGNGKTVIKGGWGRYDHFRELNPELRGANRNSATTTTWNWRDLNGNRNYDRGEVNLDPNGPDFQGISGTTDAVLNPNEKQPKTDEFSLTLERELIANWAARVTGVYARNFNNYRLAEINRPYEAYNIPITNRDPGPDGRVGTADDPGTFVTYYDYPASLAGRRFAGTMLINDPRADSDFKTIEVATTKRLSQGWQLMAAYTVTKSNIPFNPLLPFNPNAEINTANQTWEWTGKISGAYAFPYQILASANFDHRSGVPQARQVLFTGGQQIRSIVLNVEPLGSIRVPTTNVVDVRAARRFRLGGARSLELRADVFNLLNINTPVVRVVRSGADYLVPAQQEFLAGRASRIIMEPRILHLGATFSF